MNWIKMNWIKNSLRLAVSFVLATLLAATAFADTPLVLFKKYENAVAYLYDKPCPNGPGLRAGKVVIEGVGPVGLCWLIENGVVWMVDELGNVVTADPTEFKPLGVSI